MDRPVTANRQPREYYTQGDIRAYCGGFTIHAVLSSYGRTDGREPWEYEPTYQELDNTTVFDVLSQSLGFTTPRLMKLTLQQNGLDTQVKRASWRDGLDPVKKHIKNTGNPVILLVGTSQRPDGSKNPFARHYRPHWLSVWGYDDHHIYTQDSYTWPSTWDDVDIGNIARSQLDLIKDWRGSLISRIRPYTYLPIKTSSTAGDTRYVPPTRHVDKLKTWNEAESTLDTSNSF